MKKKLFKITLLSFLILTFLSLGSFAGAQELPPNTPPTASNSFKDKMANQADMMQGSAGLGDVTIGVIAAAVIQAALGLLGIIFLVIVVFAGYRWMTASGNEEQVKKAQDAIKRGIIGLAIVILAYAVTAFVFNNLPFGGTVGGDSPGHNTSGK